MDTVVGGYRLLDKVGHGGYGAVWRAVGPEGGLVALKILHPQFTEDAEQVARLVGEFMLTARLDHPNIVRSRALVPHGGSPVLVMDLVPGTSLASRLRSGGSLPLVEAVELVRLVAGALDRAHAAGIVHRDVKPANILLEPVDGGTVPRLVDFGIALLAGATRHTLSGHMVGTPGYLAPEVIRGEEPSAATDVYALGLLFHECVTGVGVFGKASTPALLDHHLNTVPALPAAWPEPVRGLIAACLAKDPARRPSSAGVAGAFAEFLGRTVRIEGIPDGVTGLLPVGGVLPHTARTPLPAAVTRTHVGVPHTGSLPHAAPPERPRTGTGRWWGLGVGTVAAAATIAVLITTAQVGGSSPSVIAGPTTAPTSAAPDDGTGRGPAATTGASQPVGTAGPSGEVRPSDVVAVDPPSPRPGTPTRPGTAVPPGPGDPPAQPTDPGDPADPADPTSSTPPPPPPRSPVTRTNDVNIPIPDGGGVAAASAVTLSAPGVAVGQPGVAVVVDIQVRHAKRGDLRIVVEAPSGHRHEVLAPRSRDQRTDYTARIDLTSALPQGTAVDGRWRLLVSDHATGNTGLIDRWTVTA